MKAKDNRNLAHSPKGALSSSISLVHVVGGRSLSPAARLQGEGDEGGGNNPGLSALARGNA